MQEIKGWDHVTRVPYTPPYVLGVMNLRGMIVPVIDLRTRLNLERRSFDASTVVIVVRVQSSRGEKTVGIVVDGVSEVYSVQAERSSRYRIWAASPTVAASRESLRSTARWSCCSISMHWWLRASRPTRRGRLNA